MHEVTLEWHLQEFLLCYLRFKNHRQYGAGKRYILDRQYASSMGIKRAPAKSVTRHFQDVAPKNYIKKVTQRNMSVTKLSTSREYQIIGISFFKAEMIDCKNGKVKHTADIKGNQDDGKK